jgi:hypothetical protein
MVTLIAAKKHKGNLLSFGAVLLATVVIDSLIIMAVANYIMYNLPAGKF